MTDRSRLSGAEAVAVAALSFGSAAVVPAYLVYRAGLTINPWAVLGGAAAAAGVSFAVLQRRATWDVGELAAFGGVLAGVCAWVLWLARPNLLPIGGGVDLAHHLVLINYIARHWQLVYDPGLGAYLGDMIHYTPGSHLLVALAGAWTGIDVLRMVHPVLALTVALKSGLVFLIALRLLPRDVPRVPLALAPVLLIFVPLDYAVGSFTHDSFWAQAVAEVFACGMWWALVVWDAHPSRRAMVLFAATGAATFVIWPVWIGPLTVVFVALVLCREGLPARERLAHTLIGLGPVAAVAAIHIAGRLQWLAVAGVSGGVIRPSPGVLGWTFLIPAIIGLLLAAARRDARPTMLLVAAIAAQAAALFALAVSRGADTPYLAYKMIYLLIYPCAAASVLAFAQGWRIVARPFAGVPARWAWALVLVLGVIVVRAAAAAPRRPVVSQPVYLAGLWARTHVDPACVDYLVGESNTGYWLHLAVLDNPRTTARMADPATFEPRQAVIRWIYPDGLPFAIVDDFGGLPKDIRDSVQVLAQFGPAAVIERPRPSSCP